MNTYLTADKWFAVFEGTPTPLAFWEIEEDGVVGYCSDLSGNIVPAPFLTGFMGYRHTYEIDKPMTVEAIDHARR